jgi:predicted TPR repeat methyltransferase
MRSNLGTQLKDLGRQSEAAAEFQRSLAIDPGQSTARYLLAAVGGEPAPARAPVEYLRRLYDQYADGFETHLTQRLGYRVPELLAAAVRQAGLAVEKKLRVLDLGCGTGLCGEAVRGMAGHLVGVDLAAKMLERARARQVYDELICADALDVLAVGQPTWDLVLAADVLIYVGDLEPVFAAAAGALVAGGGFGFSVESWAGPGDWQLLPSGRFAHAGEYLERLAARHGLDLLVSEPITVRQEREAAVPGRLVLLRRKAG